MTKIDPGEAAQVARGYEFAARRARQAGRRAGQVPEPDHASRAKAHGRAARAAWDAAQAIRRAEREREPDRAGTPPALEG